MKYFLTLLLSLCLFGYIVSTHAHLKDISKVSLTKSILQDPDPTPEPDDSDDSGDYYDPTDTDTQPEPTPMPEDSDDEDSDSFY